MKKKLRKSTDVKQGPKEVSKNKGQDLNCDEGYRQLNLLSFQNDFTMLLDNYKQSGNALKVGK